MKVIGANFAKKVEINNDNHNHEGKRAPNPKSIFKK